MQQFNAAIDTVRNLFLAGHPDSAHKATVEYIRPALENEILKPHRLPAKTRVVHYTSVNVLHSILQRIVAGDSVSLRAYDTVHMNDSTEGLHFLRFLSSDDPWIRDICGTESRRNHAYVASFIVDDGEKADNLELWRTYGKEGEGCSLSFSIDEKLRLYRVLYTDAEARSTFELIRHAADILRRRLTNLTGEAPLAKIIRDVVNRIRYLYKDEAYKNEKECRFVLGLDDTASSVQFEYTESRHRLPLIRHYIEPSDLNASKVLVTNTLITLGPTLPLRDNIEYFIMHALRKVDLLGPVVALSRLPYQAI